MNRGVTLPISISNGDIIGGGTVDPLRKKENAVGFSVDRPDEELPKVRSEDWCGKGGRVMGRGRGMTREDVSLGGGTEVGETVVGG